MTTGSEIEAHPITDACFSEERPALLNASEIGSLFGVGFKTLAHITAVKRGLVEPDADDPDSPLLERGRDFEEVAAKRVQRLRPTWQIERNTLHYIDRLNRIAAIPDFLARDPERPGVGCLEIKVIAEPNHKREWLNETPPLKYLLQLATQMMLVPNCTWGAIGQLILGNFTYTTNIYEVHARDRGAEIRLRTAATDFWRAFDDGDQPAINFEKDGALIALLFPNEVPGKVVDLSTDNIIQDLLQRREHLKEMQAEFKDKLEATETEIKAKLGDAEAAIVPGWRISFKTQHRKGYPVAPTSFRVLRTARHEQEIRS